MGFSCRLDLKFLLRFAARWKELHIHRTGRRFVAEEQIFLRGIGCAFFRFGFLRWSRFAAIGKEGRLFYKIAVRRDEAPLLQISVPKRVLLTGQTHHSTTFGTKKK